ncbi:MAG: tripartite tricarboxylate transporter substrate binding protein [Betaproteobacteria bacterium]|nr:tripartite tricarboxylate transporter substrate binding protein [Betaproteobacteria bacterium]
MIVHKRIGAVLALSFAAAYCVTAGAQENYPSKPIRFIIGFPPGGSNNIVARLIAPKLTEYLGQQVVVDNRGGANTSIATALAAQAKPDGYTILMNAPGHTTNPSLIDNLSYDSIRDFEFITQIGRGSNLLATHPSFPPRSVSELISYSKANPGKVNYGSSGIGTSVHLSAELFQYMTQVKWVHLPYKGGGPGMVALLAGEISLYFGNVPTVIRHVRAGKLNGLATTGLKRSPAAPKLPTVAESGVPGYEVTSWWGLSAPAGTPRPILQRLHKATIRALNEPDVRKLLESLGAEILGTTPEEYAAFIRHEIDKWGKVIKAAGIKRQ